ncbi:MAG: hypothetical protein VR64_21625 [Desulfatitalea sp. BRH_c12]|nr:MAG: hypothetical protein VR64_21625 [Desulfatitalea sp. BRH_c12]
MSFSVMSLNLRFGFAEDGPNNWVHRRCAYEPLLAEFPRDFYAFQEVNDFQATYLAHLLPDYCYIGQRPSAPERWQNNLLFYHKRWRCVHQEHFYLSATPDIPSRFEGSHWPRQCTMGIFDNDYCQTVLVNTHFDFDAEVQIRSARLIRERLRKHTAVGPIVIMGDFNSTPDSGCFAEFTTAKNDGCPTFCNAFSPPFIGTHHKFTGINGGAAIDWILYRGKLIVEHACVITRRFAERYPSDHYPVIAGFSCFSD